MKQTRLLDFPVLSGLYAVPVPQITATTMSSVQIRGSCALKQSRGRAAAAAAATAAALAAAYASKLYLCA
jgi:hypothetical protein